jgi:hypothetical protein
MNKLIAFLLSLVWLCSGLPCYAAAEGLTTEFKNNLYVVGTITNTGAKDKVITVPVGPATGALASSTTYTYAVCPGHACRIESISIAAGVPPSGGTNTVAVNKNGSTACLAANFNPTTLTAYVAQQPALNATTSNITLAATDVLTVVWTAGSQVTAANQATVTIEVTPTDY